MNGEKQDKPLILLTGASGYIGGRLLPLLENKGLRVRCIARHPAYLISRVGKGTEVVHADLLEPDSLEAALEGVQAAYYLVHSMGAAGDFEERDRVAAQNFGRAAQKAGVDRIVYLGGLAQGEELSTHLASRHEVGRILADSGVPVIEFRASIIIGSGSLSFEMVRALVERLPVMTTPMWVRSCTQPIAVEDALAYLVSALDLPEGQEGIFEIGGADRVSYDGILREYARQRGLPRLIIPVPFMSPHLSSHWLALVTPLYAKVGRKLIEGVRNDSCVADPRALQMFDIQPRGLSDAIARAIANEDQQIAATHWSDALADRSDEHHWWGLPFGTRRVDSYSRFLCYEPEEVFAPIQCIGGENGWYAYNWMWKFRGAMDRISGGVGLRRGRRDPFDIREGDAIDFWRVEKYVKDRLLLLYAEMKLPGRAWLYFEVGPHEGGSEVRMTAVFDPVGVWGRVYWYAVYPFHFFVFNGMFRGIVRTIERSRKECTV
ncbi:MAG: SDR family oxidoreductase [bacterium]|nr:SDR family oxidoreductase [bacterium]MDT8395539.1 SDR family oxidoreductase [bacterium]